MIGRTIEMGDLIGNEPAKAVPVQPETKPAPKAKKARAKKERKFNKAAIAAAHLIGRRVRILREALGMSRTEFAGMLDMPITTLKNYELDYRMSSPELLTALYMAETTKQYTFFITTGSTVGIEISQLYNYMQGTLTESQRKGLGVH
jgi:putative transcriptional regulator